MEIFNRHSNYSIIKLCNKQELNKLENITSIGVMDDDDNYIVEYVPSEVFDIYMNEKLNNNADINMKKTENNGIIPQNINDCLDLVLNLDAFHKGMEGKTLREIYKINPEWFVQARKELRNAFMRKQIETIDQYFGGPIWENI